MTNQLNILTQDSDTILKTMPLNARAKVCILVQNSENKYLLLKRKPDEIYPNIWECPGGKLEAEEELEDCVRRELEEETGISEIDSLEYLFASTFFEDFSGKVVFVFYYKVTTDNEPSSIPEHVAFGWFAKDEAAQHIPFEAPKYAILNY